MKKAIFFAGILATLISCAGMDMFIGKQFTTILYPTNITDASTASVTNQSSIVTLSGTNYTTNTASSVNIAGLPGRGALMIAGGCGNGGGNLTFTFTESATTNGTFVTFTNTDGTVFAPVITNSANAIRFSSFRPVNHSQYLRCVVTPSAAATGQWATAALCTD